MSDDGASAADIPGEDGEEGKPVLPAGYGNNSPARSVSILKARAASQSPAGPEMVPSEGAAETQRRFQLLVEPHLGALLRFARRHTGDPSDAEDAVQEACLRAWTAFADLRDETRIRAWLYRILRGVLSDALKRDGRRGRLAGMRSLEDVPEKDLAGDGDAVFAEVAARLSSEAVHAALAAIPVEYAVAVEMHDIDGLRYQEIADCLEVPLGTVMSRISRGRRLLARAVEAVGSLPPANAGRRYSLEREC